MSLTFKNKPSKAMSFNGNQYVEIPHGSILNFERTDPLSICCWIRTTTTGQIFSKSTPVDSFSGRGYRFLMFASDTLDLVIRNTGASNTINTNSSSIPSLTDGQIHFVCCTYDGSSDGSGVTFYFDGVALTTNISTNNLTDTIQNTENARIGNWDTQYFEGYMRNLCVFDYELTQSDVETIYNNGRMVDVRGLELSGNMPVGYWPLKDGSSHVHLSDGYDLDGYDLDGTIVNYNNSLVENGLRAGGDSRSNSYGLSFNGTDQYGSMPHDPSLTFISTDPYTVIAWVAHDGTDGGYVVSKMNGTPRGWGVFFNSDGSLETVQIDDSSGLTRQRETSAGAFPPDNELHLCAWSYDGSESVTGMQISVDNVSQSMSTIFNDAANTYGGTSEINFAARSSGTGAIAKQKQSWAAVYSGVLSAEEMEAIYLAGPYAPPPKENRLLTAWFKNGGETTVPAFPGNVTLNNSPPYVIERYVPPKSAGKLGTDYDPVALFTLDTTLDEESGNGLAPLTVFSGTENYVRYESGAHGYYSGATDSLELATTESSLQITGDLTIEFTYYCRELAGSKNIIIDHQVWNSDLSSNDNVLYQVSVNTNGSLQYLCEFATGTNVEFNGTAGIIQEDNLYHIVVTRELSVVRFYVNGVLTDTSGTLTDPTNGVNGVFRVSGRTGFEANGIVSNVKIIDRALSEYDINRETDRVLGRVKVNDLFPGILFDIDADNAVGTTTTDQVADASTNGYTFTDNSGPVPLNLSDADYRGHASFGSPTASDDLLQNTSVPTFAQMTIYAVAKYPATSCGLFSGNGSGTWAMARFTTGSAPGIFAGTVLQSAAPTGNPLCVWVGKFDGVNSRFELHPDGQSFISVDGDAGTITPSTHITILNNRTATSQYESTSTRFIACQGAHTNETIAKNVKYLKEQYGIVTS